MGRNGQIHICFAEAGVGWEDVHWGREHVKDESKRTAFFQRCRELGGNLTTNVPMLEMNGQFYTQSSAVLRLVARMGGLYPKGVEVEYMLDNIIAAAEDLRSACYRARGGPEAKQDFIAKQLPKHLGNFERLLGNNSFFVGGSFSIADASVFDVLHNYVVGQVPGSLTAYPKLAAYHDRIKNRPCIARYLASEQRAALHQIKAI